MRQHGKERRSGAALELAAAHLAHDLHVGAPAGLARGQVCSRDSLILWASVTSCVSDDRTLAISAHPSRRCDRCGAVELSAGSARRGLDRLGRQVEDPRGQLDPRPARGHNHHDLPLKLAELRHEVRGTGKPILELHNFTGRGFARRFMKGDGLEVHASAAPDAKLITTLVVVAQQEPHSRPESTHQVLLGRDRLAHHHDRADRLVDDLLKHVVWQAAKVGALAGGCQQAAPLSLQSKRHLCG
jgi:hypothetical protein